MAPKQLTRLWHDPEFDPLSDQQDEAQAIAFTHIVFDEPEIDKILHRLPGSVYDRLKRVKRRNRNWKKKKRKERVALYESEKAARQIPGEYTF
jgi:hypothetical protein